MARVTINPECWCCGATIRNDGECPKCHLHKDDEPNWDEIDILEQQPLRWVSNEVGYVDQDEEYH